MKALKIVRDSFFGSPLHCSCKVTNLRKQGSEVWTLNLSSILSHLKINHHGQYRDIDHRQESGEHNSYLECKMRSLARFFSLFFLWNARHVKIVWACRYCHNITISCSSITSNACLRFHFAIPSFEKSILQETSHFFSGGEAQHNENPCKVLHGNII